VTDRQFSAQRISDPSLLALVQRVEVRRHHELSSLYPDAVGNIVTIRTRGGRVLSQRVDHASGHAKNPMSDAAVEAKFRAQAGPMLGEERTEALLRWAWKLESAVDLSDLQSLIEVKGERLG